MKTLAILQARMGSTRAPGKVMRDLHGQPVLRWCINALRMAPGVDQIVLATSTLPGDDVIENYCRDSNIECFRGSETDVLDRFYQCAKLYNADIVLRFTADCCFLDPIVVGEVIKLREMTNAAYASNVDPPTYPDGLDTECFTFETLATAWKEAILPTDRDCVTQFIIRNRHRFKAANLHCPLPGLANERWVLDTEADWEFCHKLAIEMVFTPDKDIKKFDGSTYLNILEILDKKPELRKINAGAVRNERFYEGLATDELSPRTFERSARVFNRAIKTIPFGAQTFSKSHLQFPTGRAPLYASHGDGAYIFDVDGNRYVDLVSAVLPVVLGYRDPDVDEAIRHQLDQGISFSLATELESELSELMSKHIPCAQMVKFGKSGTDVTSAAIRLARAHTGRDTILMSGYHGWADWSMGPTDRNLGIPEEVRELTHRIKYGDRDDRYLQAFKSLAAAVIVEPNDNPEYLTYLREFCTKNGIVLIFDEVITGFRYSIGGAQALFGVTPDLACFGKAMANGMPISAVVGRRDIMKLMSPPNNIFYSGTMFGETLSIAAAIATIKKMEREDVIGFLWKNATWLEGQICKQIAAHGLEGVVCVTGSLPITRLEFKDHPNGTKDQIRTLFMQEMIQNGVLIIASNNISFAHKAPELKRIITAYDATFQRISECLRDGTIDEAIGGSVVSAAPLRATA